MSQSTDRNARVLQVAILAVSAVICGIGFSNDDTFSALVRKNNGRAEIKAVTLDKLTDRSKFETRDFRIVLKKDDAAISTDVQDEGLKLRAATALYHLQKARTYFVERIESEDAARLEQVIVRLDITNEFSELGHFANDKKNPQYNNAVTIPAGKHFVTGEPWSREIWFRPKKEIPVKELLAEMGEDPFNPVIRQVHAAILPNQADIAIRNFLAHAFSPQGIGRNLWRSTVRQAGTLFMIEGALQASRVVNRVLIPNRFYIDAAMVPEILYHEFSHVALSGSLEVSHSTPVIEGMADYFAADLSGDPVLAAKIKKFSTAVARSGKKKKEYSAEYEYLGNAHSDFVLSMLWAIRDVLGAEQTTALVFEARKHLSTRDSDIRSGLTEALITACKSVCADPKNDSLKLYRFFNDIKL